MKKNKLNFVPDFANRDIPANTTACIQIARQHRERISDEDKKLPYDELLIRYIGERMANRARERELMKAKRAGFKPDTNHRTNTNTKDNLNKLHRLRQEGIRQSIIENGWNYKIPSRTKLLDQFKMDWRTLMNNDPDLYFYWWDEQYDFDFMNTVRELQNSNLISKLP